MADQFLGEIRVFAFGATPAGWMSCDGQLLNITSETAALFAILGIRFGGNGRQNFGLPNLNGRAPVGEGSGPGLSKRELGNVVGTETVSLSVDEFPTHYHYLQGVFEDASANTAGDEFLAIARTGAEIKAKRFNAYITEWSYVVKMGSKSVSTVEAKQEPHNNMQPFLALRFCIATSGTYP